MHGVKWSPFLYNLSFVQLTTLKTFRIEKCEIFYIVANVALIKMTI